MPSNLQSIYLVVGGTEIPISVEIADSPAEQEQGLMNRTSITKDQGMLFVFEKPKFLTFWMKNTVIPLDILFFDGQGVFINVLTMDPCKADPCPLFNSDRKALYALELSSGFFAERLALLLQEKGAELRLRFAEARLSP